MLLLFKKYREGAVSKSIRAAEKLETTIINGIKSPDPSRNEMPRSGQLPDTHILTAPSSYP
jgi:hypothetical protein